MHLKLQVNLSIRNIILYTSRPKKIYILCFFDCCDGAGISLGALALTFVRISGVGVTENSGSVFGSNIVSTFGSKSPSILMGSNITV